MAKKQKIIVDLDFLVRGAEWKNSQELADYLLFKADEPVHGKAIPDKFRITMRYLAQLITNADQATQ